MSLMKFFQILNYVYGLFLCAEDSFSKGLASNTILIQNLIISESEEAEYLYHWSILWNLTVTALV